MKFFADSIIIPYIRRAGYRRLCEVGVSYGENTRKLLELESVSMTLVDPCLDMDVGQLAESRVEVRQGLSLAVLATMDEHFDCVLLDGDHNWYTVYNELRLLHERGLLRRGGTVFLHDVRWPYGRRDMYYQPETIPAEYRQPYAAKGMAPGQSALVDEGGVNAERFNAAHEGGPRNGVLTAVEDLMRQHPGEYRLIVVDPEYGLAVLYRRGDPRAFLAWLRLWVQRRRAARAARRRVARPELRAAT